MSITMNDGLIDQGDKFKKRIASADISKYNRVYKNDLVIGFPIDEGVLGFQTKYDVAAVSPQCELAIYCGIVRSGAVEWHRMGCLFPIGRAHALGDGG